MSVINKDLGRVHFYTSPHLHVIGPISAFPLHLLIKASVHRLLIFSRLHHPSDLRAFITALSGATSFLKCF